MPSLPCKPAKTTGVNSGLESMPESNHKARELLEEFRAVAGRVGLLDTILPPILFLILNGLAGFNAAMIGALGLAVLIAILRLRRGQSLLYALAGMASVGLAIALAYLFGRCRGIFPSCHRKWRFDDCAGAYQPGNS